MKNFAYATLTDDNKSFLIGYKPKSRYFTSKEEMELIEKHFNFDSFTELEDLRALRNSIVRFYDEAMEISRSNDEDWYDIMVSMQSVTAVIDNKMYNF